jgi:hypothetical protein
VVVESDPPNYSTRFSASKAWITFDEFIVVDNVNQELVVSPPMEEKPEISLRNKTLIIEFREELKSNTTYTLNFGSAIKDLHEGNKLLNYEYVFSTGDVLDSLSVKGTLKYAGDLSVPKDPITIMLYNDLRDSVPVIQIPLYIGRSDDSGVFSVNNLKADIYKVFALKDGNNNWLFDLPTEEIAFLDTSLIVNAEFARSLLAAKGYTDTITLPAALPDTTGMEPDSLTEEGPDFNSIYIDLLLFVEENEIQYLMNQNREDRRRIDMVFAKPLTDSFSYRFLAREETPKVEVLEAFSAGRDSLALWMRDSADYRKDTLVMEVSYTVMDSTQQYIIKLDTLLFAYREKKTRTKKEIPVQKEQLVISTIRKNGDQDLNGELRLDLNVPLAAFNDSLVSLFHIPDSVELTVPFRTRPDTLVPTRGWIGMDWESSSSYRLRILPGGVTSIYDLEHDTVDVLFRTRDIEYYGRILLNLENVHDQVLIQLLSKNILVNQLTVDQPGQYTFNYLVPQDYQIKFIHDRNGNGKWDTGKYMKKQQPERVEFLPKEITVRSNWDHDVNMRLEK